MPLPGIRQLYSHHLNFLLPSYSTIFRWSSHYLLHTFAVMKSESTLWSVKIWFSLYFQVVEVDKKIESKIREDIMKELRRQLASVLIICPTVLLRPADLVREKLHHSKFRTSILYLGLIFFNGHYPIFIFIFPLYSQKKFRLDWNLVIFKAKNLCAETVNYHIWYFHVLSRYYSYTSSVGCFPCLFYYFYNGCSVCKIQEEVLKEYGRLVMIDGVRNTSAMLATFEASEVCSWRLDVVIRTLFTDANKICCKAHCLLLLPLTLVFHGIRLQRKWQNFMEKKF